MLGNGFYSSCCLGCCENDAPAPAEIRGGGYDSQSESGDDSGNEPEGSQIEDTEFDEVEIAGMADEYAAQQQVVDQERQEEEKEEEDGAQVFPADNEAVPRVVHMPDSTAELDIDDDEAFDINFESDEFAFTATSGKPRPEGYMQEFCYEVHKRLKTEYKKIAFEASATTRWLKQHLKQNDYWLLPCHMATIATKLGLTPRHKSYYKRIYVWLSDDRWGELATPCCPNC